MVSVLRILHVLGQDMAGDKTFAMCMWSSGTVSEGERGDAGRYVTCSHLTMATIQPASPADTRPLVVWTSLKFHGRAPRCSVAFSVILSENMVLGQRLY